MLNISTGKIKYSTLGASFTVTFSVNLGEIGYLCALHKKYREFNGYCFSTSIAEQTEPRCERCRHYKTISTDCDRCDKHTHSRYEPTTDCRWGEPK